MATNTATSRTPLEVRTASYVSTYTSIHTALMFPKLFSSSMTASTLLSTFNTHVRTLNTLDKRLFLSVPVSVYMCGQQKRANQKDGVFFDEALNPSDCAEPRPVSLKCCGKPDKCAFGARNYYYGSFVKSFPKWPFILSVARYEVNHF